MLASGTALGIVVYTGRETRSVMNTTLPESKVGLLDLEVCLNCLDVYYLFACNSLSNFSGEQSDEVAVLVRDGSGIGDGCHEGT